MANIINHNKAGKGPTLLDVLKQVERDKKAKAEKEALAKYASGSLTATLPNVSITPTTIKAGSISASSIPASSLGLNPGYSSVITEEQKEKLKLLGLNMVEWEISQLNKLFGLEWENTLLYSVLHRLDLIDNANAGVAGGAIVRSLLGKDIFQGDLDLFVADAEIPSVIKHLESKGCVSEPDGPHAKNLEYKFGAKKLKVQIVPLGADTLTERMSKMDFEHCKVGLYRGRMFASNMAIPALANKQIILGDTIKQPAYTIKRFGKYVDMGFNFNASALETLTFMVAENMTDVSASSIGVNDMETYFKVKREAAYGN